MTSLTQESFIPEILYEDNHVMVVNKPAGLLSQGDKSRTPSLLDLVKKHIKIRDKKPGNVFLGLVHRLDRPVSGTMIFAKTSKAASRISREIRERKLQKMYLAFTAPAKTSQSLYKWNLYTSYFTRENHKTLVCPPHQQGKKGSIKTFTLHDTESGTLHLIQLISGRKHQIRAQLAQMDIPIAGDNLYGSTGSWPRKDQIALHAYSVSIKHPTKGEMINCTAPVPKTFLSMSHIGMSQLQTYISRAMVQLAAS